MTGKRRTYYKRPIEKAKHDLEIDRLIEEGKIEFQARCSCGWRAEDIRSTYRHSLFDAHVHHKILAINGQR